MEEATKGRSAAAERKPRTGSEKRRKGHRTTIRWNEAEMAELTQAADRAGQTVGTYVRISVLTAPTTRQRRRPTIEVQAIARLQAEMNKVGSNIHQISRRINFGDTPAADEIRAAFAGYREVIAAILAALNRAPGQEQGSLDQDEAAA